MPDENESAVRHMDLTEFVEDGYLQEANRLFFHPLGLALCVAHDPVTQSYEIAGVLDAREDPEGFIYDNEMLQEEIALIKARRIRDEMLERAEDRIEHIDTVVQEIPGLEDEPANHAGELLVRLTRLMEAVTGVEDLAALRESPEYQRAQQVLNRFPL